MTDLRGQLLEICKTVRGEGITPLREHLFGLLGLIDLHDAKHQSDAERCLNLLLSCYQSALEGKLSDPNIKAELDRLWAALGSNNQLSRDGMEKARTDFESALRTLAGLEESFSVIEKDLGAEDDAVTGEGS